MPAPAGPFACAARKRRTTIATFPSRIFRRSSSTPARIAAIRDAMPELPDARRQRFVEEYALPEYDAGQLTQSRALADYFEATVRAGAPPKLASNWVMGELARKLKDDRRGPRGGAARRPIDWRA